MKRFLFRLEKLLDLRKFREREWEMKLAEITGLCMLIRKKMTEVGLEINRTMNERKQNDRAVRMEDLRLSELYVTRLEKNLVDLNEELARKEEERQKVQLQYLEASKKRKVIDKLKERKGDEYYHAQKIEEFKILDEINDSALIRAKITK